MPVVSMRNFLNHIGTANDGFRQNASSLNNIILLLGGNAQNSPNNRNINNRTAENIEGEIHGLPVDKLLKYQTALVYLGNALNIDSFARPTNYNIAFMVLSCNGINFEIPPMA